MLPQLPTYPHPKEITHDQRDALTQELVFQAKTNEYILNYLLAINEPVLAAIARSYHIRNHEVPDLLNIAMAEFCLAVQDYEDGREAKFMTLATNYVHKKYGQLLNYEGAHKRGGSRRRGFTQDCYSLDALFEEFGDTGLQDVSLHGASQFESPERICLANDLFRQVDQQLTRCKKPRDKAIVQDFLFHDINQHQLAKAYGLNQSTISRIISQHIGFLRTQLKGGF